MNRRDNFFLHCIRYDELLQERLRQRRERIAKGEPVDDLDIDALPEEETEEQTADAKTILEDLQKRFAKA